MISSGFKGVEDSRIENMYKIHIVEILNKDLWVVLKRLSGNQETERLLR